MNFLDGRAYITAMINALIPFIEKCTTMPRAAWCILAAGLVSLAFVLITQFSFGYEPCILCLWQRVPYGVASVVAIAALLMKPYGRRSLIPLGLATLSFTIGAVLAIFHTGVELHWWLGTSGCSIRPLNGTAVEDLRTQLLHTVAAHCDEISWTFLGLSMANWNVLASLGLATFCALAVRRAIDLFHNPNLDG